jgi:hypothetical protein
MLAITNVDKALLIAEWAYADGDTYAQCPVCKGDNENPSVPHGHKPDCEMDLALAERGFPDQHARDTARASFK